MQWEWKITLMSVDYQALKFYDRYISELDTHIGAYYP